MKNKKRLIQTESLEYVIKIKNILSDNNIQYTNRIKAGNGLGQFFALLLVSGRGSYGLNDEHTQHYSIYVHEEKYEQAMELIHKLD